MNRITDDILSKVEKPARYCGGEINSYIKDKNNIQIRYAFCFPDVYEVGMSHLGMKILYYVLNERQDTYCERVFHALARYGKAYERRKCATICSGKQRFTKAV